MKATIKKLFADAKIDTPASNRLLVNIDKQKSLIGAQSAIANSILAGSGLKTVKENFDKVEIETETDRIRVESEPKENMADEETIAPISADIESEFKDESEPEDMGEPEETSEDEVDLDVDEIQEESFNTLAEGYLKKVYENVKSYKTTKVSNNGNKLIFEGIIKFTSGNSKKTSFIFESSTATRSGKVKFIGENKQITRGKKAFMLEGKLNKNSLLTESLRYNYKAKDSTGKSSRIYGRILSK